MIEHKQIRFATSVGAAWWLAGVAFLRPERGNLDMAMQALDFHHEAANS